MELNIEEMQSDGEALIRTFVAKQSASDILPTTNKLQETDSYRVSNLDRKLVPPPFDPDQLGVLLESSSILSPCIDTMEINVDSFGFMLEPSVDETEFEKLKGQHGAEIEAEHARVKNFFKYCNRRLSYIQVRKRTRRDYETTGNGYWEILRNHVTGMVTGIEWMPSHSMRIGRIDKKFTDYMSKRKISDTEIEISPDKMKFRRYAQIHKATVGGFGGQKVAVWFKEYGDPRLMDAETGARASVQRNEDGVITSIDPEIDKEYEKFDVEKFEKGEMKLATEILHFMNYKSSRALPYGVPRWIGNLISVMGGRSAEEVNYLYFEHKTVPPGMLMVAGAKLSNNSVDRISNHIRENVKGTKNFHSILVIEAEGNKNPNLPDSGIPNLQWVPMTDAQNSDALFQNYEQNSIEKIVSSFRFWQGYVSRTKEINVATAEVARQLSEEQVFAPERDDFDAIINRTLIVDMNVNYWEHKSKAPQLVSAKQLAEMLDRLKSFITAGEGREIAEKIFGIDFEDIKEEWANLPPVLALAAITKADTSQLLGIESEMKDIANLNSPPQPGAEADGEPKPGEPKPQGNQPPKAAPVAKEDDTEAFVKKVMALRDAMLKSETEKADEYVRG